MTPAEGAAAGRSICSARGRRAHGHRKSQRGSRRQTRHGEARHLEASRYQRLVSADTSACRGHCPRQALVCCARLLHAPPRALLQTCVAFFACSNVLSSFRHSLLLIRFSLGSGGTSEGHLPKLQRVTDTARSCMPRAAAHPPSKKENGRPSRDRLTETFTDSESVESLPAQSIPWKPDQLEDQPASALCPTAAAHRRCLRPAPQCVPPHGSQLRSNCASQLCSASQLRPNCVPTVPGWAASQLRSNCSRRPLPRPP